MRRIVFDCRDGEFYLFPEGVNVGNYLEVQLLGGKKVITNWYEDGRNYEILSFHVMVTCSTELNPFEADLRFVWEQGRHGLPELLLEGEPTTLRSTL